MRNKEREERDGLPRMIFINIEYHPRNDNQWIPIFMGMTEGREKFVLKCLQ